MKDVCIRLDLSRHCIETAIRKRYNCLVGRALRSTAIGGSLEAELELLKTALETFDFGRLRSTYPELAGRSTDIVELEAYSIGTLRIRINGSAIEKG